MSQLPPGENDPEQPQQIQPTTSQSRHNSLQPQQIQPTMSQSRHNSLKPQENLNALPPSPEGNASVASCSENVGNECISKTNILLTKSVRKSTSHVRFQLKEATKSSKMVQTDPQSKPSTSNASSPHRLMVQKSIVSQARSVASIASNIGRYFENIVTRTHHTMESQRAPRDSNEKSEDPRPPNVDKSVQTEDRRTSSFGLYLWGGGSSQGFWSPETAALLIGVIVAALVTLVLGILIVLKYKKEKTNEDEGTAEPTEDVRKNVLSRKNLYLY